MILCFSRREKSIISYTSLVLVLVAALAAAEFAPPVTQGRPSIGPREAVLVNGRKVTPAGKFLRTRSYNWCMAVSADESTIALLGTWNLDLIHLRPELTMTPIPPDGGKGPDWLGWGTYLGSALSPDGRRLYLGESENGAIAIADLKTRKRLGTINLNATPYWESFTGDFALTADEKTLVALDRANNRLAVVDVASRTVTRSVRIGRQPFAVRLTPDGTHAWVCHVGMFDYPTLPGVTEATRTSTGLVYPAYGIPSREAEEGTTAEGLKVPGLGSPNHPDGMSVFKVNLVTGEVEAKIKTGWLVGADREGIITVGGASPASVAIGESVVYVANATNDTISVVNQADGKILAEIPLTVPGMEHLRGVLPFEIALSTDETRLYAACAGLNAVAVVDPVGRTLLGYIPAGWFCSNVAVSRDGTRLFVSSAKGMGSGPNGGKGFTTPKRGAHPGYIMQGLFQVVPVPDAAGLAKLTAQVVANTVRKVPAAAALPPVKHVVFIVKENRSFDQVFGQRPDVAGDPTLASLGVHRDLKGDKGKRVLKHVDVTPNHQALADRFAISDNFHCDSDQSNTGHRWVVGVYPNEWVEVNARSDMNENPFSPAPGRHYVAGSSAAIFPEDYNEAGALWEHLDRHHISFWNFGFGIELPAALEERFCKETGIRMAVSWPLPKPLFDRTSRTFPTFNMAIPDQYRVDMFENDLRDRWESGKEEFPQVITMVLPQDHMAGEDPDAGYPFSESYVADNDLALGRVIQTLSHSRWWKDMLVIVAEDDPQGGRDHLEAHRSVIMFMGPMVKKHYVSHTLMDFGSVMKLIFTSLGLPPLNQFDAAASLPADIFAATPDSTPYAALVPDKRLFDPDLAFKPFDRRFNWKGIGLSPVMDDPDDMYKGFQEADDRLR